MSVMCMQFVMSVSNVLRGETMLHLVMIFIGRKLFVFIYVDSDNLLFCIVYVDVGGYV